MKQLKGVSEVTHLQNIGTLYVSYNQDKTHNWPAGVVVTTDRFSFCPEAMPHIHTIMFYVTLNEQQP